MRLLALIALVALPLAPVFAQSEPAEGELVESTAYQSWARFGVGTQVVIRTAMVMAGNTTLTTQTSTLKSLTAEKAVVSIQTVTVVAGKEVAGPAYDMQLPAKVKKTAPPKPAEGAPKPKTEKGTASLEVDGKTFACDWMKTTLTMGGNPTVTQIWYSKTMPGSLVKSVTTSASYEQTQTVVKVVIK